MDPLPPPYKQSASVSRSSSKQDDLRRTTDALLRGPVPRSTSSASTVPPPATPLAEASSLRDELKAVTDTMLHSSTSRSLSRTSASVSRSSASQGGIGAAADALLRSPLSRSVSTHAPASVSPFPATSVSRSNASQSSLGVEAEVSPRSPLPRSVSSTVSSLALWASSAASSPPSYRAGQYSSPSTKPDSLRTLVARPRPPIVGSPPSLAPVSPIPSRSRDADSLDTPSISAAESKRRVRQMQSAVDKANATAPTRNIRGLFRTLCSTDLLFIMDTTSSMQKYIDAAKDQVRGIMTEIQRAFLNEPTVRVAVIGYKDHCDSPNVEFLDFTTSMDEARDFLSSLCAKGGEGWTADALGGLRQASKAKWMQATRCIVHIADAPGHSNALHDMSEEYDKKYYKPGSEPHGLTYDPVMQTLAKLGIDYTFLHINKSTDRMAMAFSRIYDAAGADYRLLPTNRYFNTISAQGFKLGGSSIRTSKRSNSDSPQLLFQELPIGIDTSSLRRLVLKSVTESVTRTSSRHSIALGKITLNSGAATHPSKGFSRHSMLSTVCENEKDETVEVPLETDPPRWDSPGWLDKKWCLEGYCPEVVVYSESTLGDMMASDDNIKLSFVQLTVHARSKPFSQGAQRMASYARIAASANRFVVKYSTRGGKGLENLIEEMRMQALCKAFALEFNGLVRPEQYIDFVVTACLQSQADATAGGEACLSLEPYLAGDYVKYNSNGLYVKEDSPEDRTNRVAQAFSHFTFERSWGHFMVVDLQGVGNLLTDPVIHALDPNRFKLNDLNLSSEGFKFFFALHDCNEVCRQLGLVSHRDMASSGNWQFRPQWPSMDPTVCCSNKFCQGIVRLANANTSSEFPGYRWCDLCWHQLQASTLRWICAAPGDIHEYDVCKFFYESQGKLPPRRCPVHVEKDTTLSSAADVGGSMWSQMKTVSKKRSILGNEY